MPVAVGVTGMVDQVTIELLGHVHPRTDFASHIDFLAAVASAEAEADVTSRTASLVRLGAAHLFSGDLGVDDRLFVEGVADIQAAEPTDHPAALHVCVLAGQCLDAAMGRDTQSRARIPGTRPSGKEITPRQRPALEEIAAGSTNRRLRHSARRPQSGGHRDRFPRRLRVTRRRIPREIAGCFFCSSLF